MLRSLIVILLPTLPLVAAPVPKGIKNPPRLEGKWVTVERVMLGQDVSADKAMEWVVDGEKLTMYDRPPGEEPANAAPSATVTLAPAKNGKPDELDFLFIDGDRHELYKGGAAWDGEELLINFAKPDADRPTEVKATASVYHYRFKRAKDK